jgi:hypothetical protein
MPGRIVVKGGSTQKMVVTTTPKNRILINTFNGTGGAGGVQELVKLKDVDASHVANNETVVYDAQSGKFVIEALPILDGGEF